MCRTYLCKCSACRKGLIFWLCGNWCHGVSFSVFFSSVFSLWKLAWRTKATEPASSTPLESGLHGTHLLISFFLSLLTLTLAPTLIVNKSNYFNISCITRMGSSSRFGLFVFYEKLKLKFLTVKLRYYVAVCLVLVFNIENSYVFFNLQLYFSITNSFKVTP